MPQGRLLVFDTHPIQYRAPVFQSVHRKNPAFKVYFFNSQFNPNRWWFHEKGKHPKQPFGVPMTQGYPSETLDTDQLPLWKRYSLFRGILEKERPTAVLIYGYFLPEHWMLRALCQRKEIPLLFVGETFRKGRTVTAPLIKLFFSGVAQCIAIGEKTAKFYEQWLMPRHRIVPAKYCVDTAFFSLDDTAAKTAREKIRRSLGISEDAFVVLFVGRLFDRKRPHDVLDLHRRFSSNPRFHTIVIGNGELEEAIRIAGAKLPRFHTVGFKNQSETRDFYHAVDLLYVPSEYETWGLVVNEAFTAGTPALVTDTCGVAEDLVVTGETGAVYPVGKVEVAAEIIARWLNSSTDVKRLGKAAKEKVLKSYRTDQFAENILVALRHATDKRLMEPEL